jgi:hypothetical protein
MHKDNESGMLIGPPAPHKRSDKDEQLLLRRASFQRKPMAVNLITLFSVFGRSGGLESQEARDCPERAK